MGKFQGVRKISLAVSFFLIITFALLININFAGAGGLGSIGANQGMDRVVLFKDQTRSYTTSQIIPYGTRNIFFISIGNTALAAELRDITDTATGFWWVSAIAAGGAGESFFDLRFGVIPHEGKQPQITLGQISPGIVSGGLYITSPVSAEEPVDYTIKVKAAAPDYDY